MGVRGYIPYSMCKAATLSSRPLPLFALHHSTTGEIDNANTHKSPTSSHFDRRQVLLRVDGEIRYPSGEHCSTRAGKFPAWRRQTRAPHFQRGRGSGAATCTTSLKSNHFRNKNSRQ